MLIILFLELVPRYLLYMVQKMNKLHLLLFASLLSIQTPVINSAFAAVNNEAAIAQEEEEEATQDQLTGIYF